MLQNLELSDEGEAEVFQYCLKREINFISTPYSVPAVKGLMRLAFQNLRWPLQTLLIYLCLKRSRILVNQLFFPRDGEYW